MPIFAVLYIAVLALTMQWGMRNAFGWSIIGSLLLFGTLGFDVPAVQVQLVLSTLVLGACSWRPERERTALIGLGVAAVVAWIAGVALTRPELAQLQRDYPVVDLSERLAYETENRAIADTGPSPGVWERLEEFEVVDGLSDRSRRRALRRIHDGQLARFVDAQGFGVGRMLGMTRYEIEDYRNDSPRPDSAPRQPLAANYRPSSGPVDFVPAAHRTPLHWSNVSDFIAARGLGVVVTPRRAVGFEAHRLTQDPDPIVQRIELVSLLRHPLPVVYESPTLPDLAKLGDYTTRPLDEFELRALPTLGENDDVVVARNGDRLRMLGAIRASMQCLGCHSVERGELLGAFTYELRP